MTRPQTAAQAAPTTGAASPRDRDAYQRAARRYEAALAAVTMARELLDMALAEREDAEANLAEHEARPGVPAHAVIPVRSDATRCACTRCVCPNYATTAGGLCVQCWGGS